MNEGDSIEINKSSLVSLKAELLRKKNELQKTKLVPVKRAVKPFLEIINKTKATSSNVQTDDDYIDEDIAALNSQAIMERKALLYEKLMNSQNEEDSRDTKNYLVQFNKKVKLASNEGLHNATKLQEDDELDEIDDWVEYTDCLGRTKKCLKDDLEFMKNKDIELQSSLGVPNRLEVIPETKIQEMAEIKKNNEKSDLIKKKWSEKEEELKSKNNVHYEDVLFDEARVHGVGYFAFSQNEDERLKEQEALKNLRKETTEKQKMMRYQNKVREKMMKKRLHAAMNRKRVRQGLVPLEMESDDDDSDDESDNNTEKESSSKVIDEMELLKEKEREKHVRPWDIGKSDVNQTKISKSYTYTQDEWVAEKRDERVQEFAPPNLYKRSITNSPSAERRDKSQKS